MTDGISPSIMIHWDGIIGNKMILLIKSLDVSLFVTYSFTQIYCNYLAGILNEYSFPWINT